MVTRKPVGPPISTAQASSASNAAPPYPTTPTNEEPPTASSVYSEDLKTSPAFDLIDMNDAQKRPQRRDSDVSSHGTWDSDGTERDDDTPEDDVEVPKPLNVGLSQQGIDEEAGKEHKSEELPAILKPGPANGVSHGVGTRAKESKQYEEESHGNPWQLESNNPYLQKTQAPNGPNGFMENSQKVWEQPIQAKAEPQQPSQGPPPPPQAPPPVPPVELSAVKSPTEEMSRMSLGEHRESAGTAASWETAEILNVPQKGQYPLSPVARVPSAEAQAFPLSNPWSEGASSSATAPVAPPKEALASTGQPPPFEFQPPPGPPPGQSGPLIDHAEPARLPPISTQMQTEPPIRSPESGAETPGTRDKRKRNEIYQIKHVNWYDSASGKASMRRLPVLTQNENGPCPLLALVNALVLSTPAGLDTPLIEALRTRETISLGFLLDGVFDELMSGRRGDTAHALPDVSELYAFLLALHTGMNVNPRFITPAATPRGSLDGHPPELHGVHPTERSQHKPGCFEETREMRLYSTFSIPLIHGWTAPKDTPVYQAFQRNAQTFEDAQNIQFAEPELEDKLRTEGLDFKEQQLLEDIQIIKSFLHTWPTQLTDYGLETISRSLHPGQLAILFRNDHFSTLYKEPRHGALMTLVTDAGYSSHDEIVWESLVDVNGAASEMFSGDFRVVSHGQDARLNQSNSGGGNDGWQTVSSRTRYHRQQPSKSNANDRASEEAPPPLPGPRPSSQQPDAELGITQTEGQRKASEQEDHDLALALQMQEEEEEQQRQAEARRRREQELSEQFLSGEERPPAIPPRRNQQHGRSSTTNVPVTGGPGRNTGPSARPAVNRPAATDDPDAPPTYEQSASDRPYRPAGATAPPSQGNPLNALDHLRRHQSAYAQQSNTSVNSAGMGPQHVRRTSQGNRIQRRSSQPQPQQTPPYSPGRPQVGGAPTVRDADERCVIM
ncbi:ubiquitin carboxyl-terminal hydrolase MINDY-2-like [Lecanosticta acicola]|uniref:Ubiquitin carboxyl-terminal hydrolase MINDY-2-like n=1 Tax=Lecanosticta acicola TaxID=111012 RepID=A0AAI9E7T8_9PEZI|nr:ubiquitin carboxyl-terminal hydrolase MINDY-2-like [Lecanosticta acicola]